MDVVAVVVKMQGVKIWEPLGVRGGREAPEMERLAESTEQALAA